MRTLCKLSLTTEFLKFAVNITYQDLQLQLDVLFFIHSNVSGLGISEVCVLKTVACSMFMIRAGPLAGTTHH